MSFLTRSLRVLVYTWLTLIGFDRAAAVEAPVRIMPLGDSITYGQSEPGVQGGYRDRLYTLLTNNGYTVDYVGTFSDTDNPELPDKNHQGAPGYRVDEIITSVNGWLDAVNDPDVILIQIGTNDFLQTSRNETPAGVLAELSTLISTIATKRPFAKIVVSTLILSTQSASVEAKQVTYNQGMPAMIAQHVALGRQVTLVDLHPVLNAGDLYDMVHPTTAGYEKMADAWLPAVTNVIAPTGTAIAPHILRTDTPNDLTKLTVTFSKPVADTATNLSHYSISGGLAVTAASLDSTSKRVVTLTTDAQTPGESYTLTVSGVRDRTAQQKLIAPVSRSMFFPNLLTNGSFEISGGDPPSYYDGWIHTGNQTIKDKTTNPPYTTPDGNKLVAFNTGDSTPNGVLAQSFPTTPGLTYRLTYSQGIASWRSTWTQKVAVSVVGDNPLFQTTSVINGNGGSSGTPAVFWFPWSYQFTADSTSTTLTFTDVSYDVTNTNRDMLLDNLRVTAPVQPTLIVTSTPNAGALINITPNDTGGNGDGTSGLIRSYNTGTTVTVVAPSPVAGRNFQKWQINGADFGTNPTVNVTISSNTALTAVYDPSGTVPPAAVADNYTPNEDSPLVIAAPGVLANDSDANALPLTAALGTGPTKGTLTLNANGAFTYTPNANSNGSDSFTYRVNNGSQNSSYTTVFLTVTAVNDPPVAVNDGTAGTPFLTIAEDSGQSSSMAVLTNDSDVEGDSLTITDASSPNGTVVTSFGDTRLRFTPTLNFHGATTISYTINDGNGGSATATVHVSVTPVNDPPVAVNDGSVGSPFVTIAEDSGQSSSMTVLINDSDVDGDNLAITDASSPNGTVVTSFGDTRLRFTPAHNFNGAATISYTISDGNGGDSTATVHVNVTPVNDAPVAVADSYSTNEDIPLAVTASGVLGNDTDVEGTALTVVLVTNVNNGTLALTPNGGFTYTPSPNFNGVDSFTYRANDGGLNSNTVTVTLTVNPVNDAPVANAQSISLNEDGTLAITLTGSDAENTPLTFAKGTCQHGLLSGTAPNLTYTPALNYFGSDSFTFTVSDGVLTSTAATVSITVAPVNDAPIAMEDSYSTDEDVPLAVTASGVLGNDTDVEGSALAAVLVTNVNNGTLALTSNGSFTYTPDANFHGNDSFTYRTSDGELNSSIVTVTIAVNPVNDTPLAIPRSISVDEDRPVNTTLTGSDVEGSPLTFAVSAQPAHGSVSLSGAVATYTPQPDYHGTDSFTFTASDGVATSAPAIVSVVVNPIDEFHQWLEGQSVVGGPTDDSDGDSISNALEFVLGGDPGEPSVGVLLPTAGLVSADMDQIPGSEEYLLFTYRRSNLSQVDPTTSVVVEWATSLTGPWSAAHETAGVETVTEPGDPVDQVKVYIPRSLEGGGLLFTRLKVVIDLPPPPPAPPDE